MAARVKIVCFQNIQNAFSMKHTLVTVAVVIKIFDKKGEHRLNITKLENMC